MAPGMPILADLSDLKPIEQCPAFAGAFLICCQECGSPFLPSHRSQQRIDSWLWFESRQGVENCALKPEALETVDLGHMLGQ